MKHLVIAGLLTAIGAIALTPAAHADSQYCYDNPDDNRCDYNPDFMPRFRPPPPPPPDSGDGYEGDRFPPPLPPKEGRYRPPQPDWGDYEPPRPPRDWGMDSRQRYCLRVGSSLRMQGFRHIRAVECGGKNFKYTGYRDGDRFLIKVKARTGRIMYVIPN